MLTIDHDDGLGIGSCLDDFRMSDAFKVIRAPSITDQSSAIVQPAFGKLDESIDETEAFSKRRDYMNEEYIDLKGEPVEDVWDFSNDKGSRLPSIGN